MRTAKVCSHQRERPELDVLLVLDAHVHFTDALARCAHCDAHYLLEMADVRNDTAVFRLSRLDAAAAAATVRSLSKGSCDIDRAGTELHNLANAAVELDSLAVMRGGKLTKLVDRPAGLDLPKRSWRSLPCDGAVIDALKV